VWPDGKDEQTGADGEGSGEDTACAADDQDEGRYY
jgi:hypothetical protein